MSVERKRDLSHKMKFLSLPPAQWARYDELSSNLWFFRLEMHRRILALIRHIHFNLYRSNCSPHNCTTAQLQSRITFGATRKASIVHSVESTVFRFPSTFRANWIAITRSHLNLDRRIWQLGVCVGLGITQSIFQKLYRHSVYESI